MGCFFKKNEPTVRKYIRCGTMENFTPELTEKAMPLPPQLIRKKTIKPSSYLTPLKKARKKRKDCTPPPAPRLRPRHKDLTTLEVIDLAARDEILLAEMLGEPPPVIPVTNPNPPDDPPDPGPPPVPPPPPVAEAVFVSEVVDLTTDSPVLMRSGPANVIDLTTPLRRPIAHRMPPASYEDPAISPTSVVQLVTREIVDLTETNSDVLVTIDGIQLSRNEILYQVMEDYL